MPLEILLVIVIGGIAGIALLLHLTGRSARLRLTDQTARRAWLRHSPDEEPGTVLLSDDGHSALVRTELGHGLVWSFGQDTVARHLGEVDVSACGSGLKIDFHDFSTPPTRITLSGPELKLWERELNIT